MIRRLPNEVKACLRTGVALTSLAQAVEELVLNSVDAGATSVAVRIDLSCFKIQVVDNGLGITTEQFPLVGERYSTSKCHTMEDLEHLNYFGYRGEALASLRSASSFLEVTSRAKSSSVTFSKCFQKGQAFDVLQSSVARPSPGTTVTAHDLFYNLPVRRKRLHADLEMERIRYRVAGIALVWPRISFSLRDDAIGHVLLQTHKCSGLVSSFSCLFSPARARPLMEVSAERDEFKLSGIVSKESYSRKNLQFVYVNKRLVLKSSIHRQINKILSRSLILKRKGSNIDALEKMATEDGKGNSGSPVKSAERFGIYVLNVECPFSAYDITFDPAKTLVEFKDWPKLIHLLQDMLYGFLRTENLISVSEPLLSGPFPTNEKEYKDDDIVDADVESDSSPSESVSSFQPLDIDFRDDPNQKAIGLMKSFGRNSCMDSSETFLQSKSVKRPKQVVERDQKDANDFMGEFNGRSSPKSMTGSSQQSHAVAVGHSEDVCTVTTGSSGKAQDAQAPCCETSCGENTVRVSCLSTQPIKSPPEPNNDAKNQQLGDEAYHIASHNPCKDRPSLSENTPDRAGKAFPLTLNPPLPRFTRRSLSFPNSESPTAPCQSVVSKGFDQCQLLVGSKRRMSSEDPVGHGLTLQKNNAIKSQEPITLAKSRSVSYSSSLQSCRRVRTAPEKMSDVVTNTLQDLRQSLKQSRNAMLRNSFKTPERASRKRLDDIDPAPQIKLSRTTHGEEHSVSQQESSRAFESFSFGLPASGLLNDKNKSCSMSSRDSVTKLEAPQLDQRQEVSSVHCSAIPSKRLSQRVSHASKLARLMRGETVHSGIVDEKGQSQDCGRSRHTKLLQSFRYGRSSVDTNRPLSSRQRTERFDRMSICDVTDGQREGPVGDMDFSDKQAVCQSSGSHPSSQSVTGKRLPFSQYQTQMSSENRAETRDKSPTLSLVLTLPLNSSSQDAHKDDKADVSLAHCSPGNCSMDGQSGQSTHEDVLNNKNLKCPQSQGKFPLVLSQGFPTHQECRTVTPISVSSSPQELGCGESTCPPVTSTSSPPSPLPSQGFSVPQQTIGDIGAADSLLSQAQKRDEGQTCSSSPSVGSSEICDSEGRNTIKSSQDIQAGFVSDGGQMCPETSLNFISSLSPFDCEVGIPDIADAQADEQNSEREKDNVAGVPQPQHPVNLPDSNCRVSCGKVQSFIDGSTGEERERSVLTTGQVLVEGRTVNDTVGLAGCGEVGETSMGLLSKSSYFDGNSLILRSPMNPWRNASGKLLAVQKERKAMIDLQSISLQSQSNDKFEALGSKESPSESRQTVLAYDSLNQDTVPDTEEFPPWHNTVQVFASQQTYSHGGESHGCGKAAGKEVDLQSILSQTREVFSNIEKMMAKPDVVPDKNWELPSCTDLDQGYPCGRQRLEVSLQCAQTEMSAFTEGCDEEKGDDSFPFLSSVSTLGNCLPAALSRTKSFSNDFGVKDQIHHRLHTTDGNGHEDVPYGQLSLNQKENQGPGLLCPNVECETKGLSQDSNVSFLPRPELESAEMVKEIRDHIDCSSTPSLKEGVIRGQTEDSEQFPDQTSNHSLTAQFSSSGDQTLMKVSLPCSNIPPTSKDRIDITEHNSPVLSRDRESALLTLSVPSVKETDHVVDDSESERGHHASGDGSLVAQSGHLQGLHSGQGHLSFGQTGMIAGDSEDTGDPDSIVSAGSVCGRHPEEVTAGCRTAHKTVKCSSPTSGLQEMMGAGSKSASSETGRTDSLMGCDDEPVMEVAQDNGALWRRVSEQDTGGSAVYVNCESLHYMSEHQWLALPSQERRERLGEQASEKASENTVERVPASLSLCEVADLQATVDRHLRQEESEATSKWRAGTRPVYDSEASADVSSLLAGWKNPVFTMFKEPSLVADTRRGDAAARSCFDSLSLVEFSKAMLNKVTVIGQLDNKFIACLVEKPLAITGTASTLKSSLLVLFDQHAVHERVRLEYLTADAYKTNVEKPTDMLRSVEIMPALTVVMDTDDVRIMKAFQKEFNRIGISFRMDRGKRDTIHITSVPACMVEKDVADLRRSKVYGTPELIQNLVKEHTDLLRNTNGACGRLPLAIHQILCSQACHGAVKFGDPLKTSQCRDLLSSLSACRLPFQCAHGRPSVAPIVDFTALEQEISSQIRKPRLWKIAQHLNQ
ncbi:uncharacterized protein LOC101854340 [Aplysia californica]|uniref:Uncharacterized protein LOC101854340 n=1 Tax=Aplysia californica TaxID=6500 RepID=A0ABM0JUL8_APLCA|nr:uncharacterized protein LOC101854340 [Aplysia californica]